MAWWQLEREYLNVRQLSKIRLPRGQAWRGVVIVSVVLVLLVVTLVALNLSLTGTDRLKDLAGVIQSVITAFAIIAGGIFAAYKWQVFRESEPHLTITNEVSHRPIGDSYVHIAVTAILHNSSKVKMEFREALFRIQQVSPVTDEEIERLYDQAFTGEQLEDLQWPTLDEAYHTWPENELIVEPGESHQETWEFIVSKDVETVIIYTYFYNSRVPQASQGWGATAILDIMSRG